MLAQSNECKATKAVPVVFNFSVNKLWSTNISIAHFRLSISQSVEHLELHRNVPEERVILTLHHALIMEKLGTIRK